jgi:CheY-like chemotaxis protein
MMPELNGFEIVEAMRQDPALAQIPVIILSAKVITETDRRRLNGDVLKIVEKSGIRRGMLLAEINRAIGN